MFAKWFPTALYVLAALGAASILFSLFGPALLAKAAFLFGAALATGTLGLSAAFVKRMKAKGNRWSHPFNANAALGVTIALGILAAMIIGIDVSVFTDMVFEGVAVSTAGLGLGVVGALLDKDEENEEAKE